MALVLVEGFDHLSNAQLATKQGRSGVSAAIDTGRLGGQALRGSAASQTGLVLSGFPATSSIIVGFAFMSAIINANAQRRVMLRSGATNVCGLTMVASGPNFVFQLLNSAGAVLGTGTTPLVPNIWYYVELKCVVSATVGAVELRLNGLSTPEIAATGLNTGVGNIDAVSICGTTTGAQTTDYDDLYIVDTTTGAAPTNDFLGDCRVETPAPNGNGANTAWAGVYTDVDDATSHDSDATYVSSATPGARETFTLPALAAAGGTVFGVQVNIAARKDDAAARTVAPVVRQGGVNYDGTVTPGLSTSYVVYPQLYDRLGPDGNAWTPAIVTATEVGVKEVA